MSTKIMLLDTQRRDNILNAALKEFALRGYDNASTNVIAKEALISKALMFHYVKNKQELFLFVYDYFAELLDNKYFSQLDFSEKDILKRLRQSYLLQINLIRQYPWIFEFKKISLPTSSSEINKALEERLTKRKNLCNVQMFDEINTSLFKSDLNVDICKQFIFWSNVGFTSQILEDIKNLGTSNIDYESIISSVDKYLDELRKIFYISNDKQ